MSNQVTPGINQSLSSFNPETKSKMSDDEEHNLWKIWEKESMTPFFIIGNLIATALWVVMAFVVKPTALGMVGVLGIFTGTQWMPYLIAYIVANGLYKKLAYKPLTAEVGPWVKRALTAHNNAMENFMLFGISVLFALQVGVPDSELIFWAHGYFFCRCYYYVFTVCPPIFMMKTAFWCMGWVCCTVIMFKGVLVMPHEFNTADAASNLADLAEALSSDDSA